MTSDIPPLRRRTKKGKLYSRPPEIEEAISETFALPFEEFITRATHKNRRHPEYLPSEVLVHRIRATRHNSTDDQFNALYTVLHERISGSCPRAVFDTDGGTGEVGYLMDVREDVLERFVILVVKDRNDYAEALDIYEARFDRAVSMLRKDALRKVLRRERRIARLEYDESGDVPDDVDESFMLQSAPSMTEEDEITYRIQVRQAIDSLPEAERRVLEMIEAGIPVESNKHDEVTISSLLECTPKTVRNRRARAIQRIREILGVEACDVD